QVLDRPRALRAEEAVGGAGERDRGGAPLLPELRVPLGGGRREVAQVRRRIAEALVEPLARAARPGVVRLREEALPARELDLRRAPERRRELGRRRVRVAVRLPVALVAVLVEAR